MRACLHCQCHAIGLEGIVSAFALSKWEGCLTHPLRANMGSDLVRTEGRRGSRRTFLRDVACAASTNASIVPFWIADSDWLSLRTYLQVRSPDWDIAKFQNADRRSIVLMPKRPLIVAPPSPVDIQVCECAVTRRF